MREDQGPVSKLDLLQGHVFNEDGVTPVTVAAEVGVDPLGLGRRGIVYTPMNMPDMRNGDMLTFTHAVILCPVCGRLEGDCGCHS